MESNWPESIRSVSHLESLLSIPSEAAVQALAEIDGDIMLLGAGGKMGPSLARMLKTACASENGDRRIVAVSRFTSPEAKRSLTESGIETIACDLLNEGALDALPNADNVFLMTGSKFGTQHNAARTWAMNTLLPAYVCRRFRSSRLVAFSTGNVYPFVPVDSGSSVETDELTPVGEYGMSALGRERVLEYHAREYEIRMSILRLNYAVEMRYGVILDLATMVQMGLPIDATMGYANVIWQADANAMAIASIADASPEPFVINIAGDEIFSIADVCRSFGDIFNTPIDLRGTPATTALLNNAQQSWRRYGKPRVSLNRIINWTADWLRRGEPVWKKPTHFQTRTGQF